VLPPRSAPRTLQRSLASAALAAVLLVSPCGGALAARSAVSSPVAAAPGAPVREGAARVVDGDTLVLNGNQRIRLYGVDAPESKQTCRHGARDHSLRCGITSTCGIISTGCAH
jgi:endonuclease YncB( thermonuclease family)